MEILSFHAPICTIAASAFLCLGWAARVAERDLDAREKKRPPFSSNMKSSFPLFTQYKYSKFPEKSGPGAHFFLLGMQGPLKASGGLFGQ